MKKIKSLLLHSALVIGLLLPFMVPGFVAAQGNEEALKCGANLEINTSGCTVDGDAAGTSISDIIQTAINIISIIVGIAAVIMIIIAGFRYITSNGDSGAISSAKNTIIYAIVGLVIVALAQLIVAFVVDRLTNDTTSSGGGSSTQSYTGYTAYIELT